MSRDNFPNRTKKNLGEAVGFNCVRPGCGKATYALNRETGKMHGIGHAAHDSGASMNGPRYSESLTREQRIALENGAHLCPTCARLVDIDPFRFPIGTISSWQIQAERCREFNLYSPHQSQGGDFRGACMAARKFLEQCRFNIEVKPKFISREVIFTIESFLRKCHPFNATNELCSIYPHMVNIQSEMIEALKRIIHELNYSGVWFRNNNDFTLHGVSLYNSSDKDAILRSHTIVHETLVDFFNFSKELNDIITSPYPKIDLQLW